MTSRRSPPWCLEVIFLLSLSVYLTTRGAQGCYIYIAYPFVSDSVHETYRLQHLSMYALYTVVSCLLEAEGVCCLHTPQFVYPSSTSRCSFGFQLRASRRTHAHMSAWVYSLPSTLSSDTSQIYSLYQSDKWVLHTGYFSPTFFNVTQYPVIQLKTHATSLL